MDQGQIGEDSLETRQSNDMEVGNAVATRKALKAGRERLRRDKRNEQFLELRHLLDPDRPKNDKAAILTDAIQELKDLKSEVQNLRAEQALLCEESRELTQEKNNIREEKASLKSDIHELKTRHQQTQAFMVPWPTVDSQILMAPSYPFPVAVPMHQTTRPLPLFAANQHIASPSPCSTYIPYIAPDIPRIDHSAALNTPPSSLSRPRASGSRSSNEQRSSRSKTGSSNDVATDLELKVPGSAAPEELAARGKSKQPERHQEKPEKW